MPRVPATELLDLAVQALTGAGAPHELAVTIATEAVAADVAGRFTHGVGKLAALQLGDPAAVPSIDVRGSLVVADGHGGNGFAVMRAVAETAGCVATSTGVAVAVARNFSRYAGLAPYTELLAARGLVALLMNGAGPAAVAPHGGADPVTGTNPICLSFPVDGGVHTFDLSTSEVVWGEIRQAALEERALVDGAFLDVTGQVTRTPTDVNAVLPFGGAKGFALNLAVELLAGPLVGAKAGLAVGDEFDLGALLLVVDPSATGGERFADVASRLLDDVRASRPLPSGDVVRAPGDRRANAPAVNAGETVEVPAATLDRLRTMASGQGGNELANDALFN